MLYPIEAYDKHGLLKPSGMLWLALAYSAKAWLIFLMAGASRAQGAQILEVIYPLRDHLYVGMGMGLPALLLMWLSGQRHKQNQWITAIWQQGKVILLFAYLADGLSQGYQLALSQGAFRWPQAVNLLLTLWLSAYLMRSTRVRNTFADQPDKG
ncbi:DUF2919 domain-containing protein [Photobacterium sp. MCCC 1A19761]|uniref:DUF2919 domain-containing protein n=1 Tax=Photobacterium sp. MCCC 1A19761 TaxID=3115000 RepID=UPI00307D1754